MPEPVTVAVVGAPAWTEEQLEAIERRSGDLLLDAAAGSGKTSVLVERFVRAVLEDGADVEAILTITFTEKAAAEMRDRIRARLRALGAVREARATEGASISTIHGFCARLLRAHALAAGIDPAFEVLDEQRAQRLADAAFDGALEELAAGGPDGVDLIAAYGPALLRGSVQSVYAELRSRGELEPALPALGAPPDLGPLRQALLASAATAALELGSIADPSVRVVQALERLDRCAEVVGDTDPWPGDLDALRLPNGNGTALCTEACVAYAEALLRFREACERRRAGRAHEQLERLLSRYGALYAARKREASGLDFEDLELMARELLRSDAELRGRYRSRFSHVMVDELQDTNAVQLELIEMVAEGNLFTVGDAQQSIYGFRHADVELFERRGARLEEVGGRIALSTNFRSRPEIIEVLNHVFAGALEGFRPLRAGRRDARASDPRVELLVADKGADWTPDGLASPWRVAEARALAGRVGELIASGAAPREIVVLTRATTDLRAYERALEERGVPTYVIGGRGYWAHPQVVDLVAYLRALANPRDEEALYTVLASPLVGVSVDALVVLADAGRSSGRDPLWVLRSPDGLLDELGEEDRGRLATFAEWFAGERVVAARSGIDELIGRALERTGYDLVVLAMPGGQRRLANVRKLMRLGREHEEAAGRDLRRFLELVRTRVSAPPSSTDARESEAPVEGEALDAVRLMTIHRAKGLEFEIVCVADLGRGPHWRSELMRVGRGARFGLRLAEPGTGKREPALEYKALGEEQASAEAREERRLFYVAMTRARERLILSGAAKLDPWPEGGGAGPIAWLGPALLGEVASRVAEGGGVTEQGARFDFVRNLEAPPPPIRSRPAPPTSPPPPAQSPGAPMGPPVSSLSYSSLGEYQRCGYRFYVERVLGLPPVEQSLEAAGRSGAAGLAAAERGVLVHELLERLDFRRPTPPTAAVVDRVRESARIARAPTEEEIAEVADLVEAFGASEVCARLARATSVTREQRFGFLLDGVLINGVFDVLAREPAGRSLVVDYKTDRLEGADPRELLAGAYETQRLVYAIAVLRTGAPEVEVAHVFLESPASPVSATFVAADADRLEAELRALTGGVLRREFRVTDEPHRGVCGGCPAAGGLCSWPLELTRRAAPDKLF